MYRMKRKVLAVIVVAVLALLGTVSFAQKIDVYSRPLRTEPSRDYQALHYRIALDLDVAKKAFTGENTVTMTPFREGLTSIALDAETFTVTAVRLADGTPLAFRQAEGRLNVEFPRPCGIGDKVTFTVFYHAEGLADTQGRKKGINFVDATQANPALIVARSFPNGARHWFPCYDHPNGKVTQEILATVPREYRALSNGRLVGVSENPERGTKTYHWSQDKPHSTYLSALIAGPYVVTENSLGPLPINYWYYKKDRKDALISFQRTPEIIAFLSKTYGYEFPWDKYDQIIVPGGGGTETTSATMLTQSIVHDLKAEKDFSVHRWLITHEAAHQWWGDLVTCRDWGHTWINESFGTYSEVQYAEFEAGRDEAAVDLLGKKNRYIQEAHARYMRPIVFHRWEEPGQNFDRHTYQKGAAVLHMMRWILGEKPFLNMLSHFLHKHAYQPADTNDVLTAIKEATGQNLDWFFDEWLLRPGHPVFDVRADWSEKTKKLTWRIVQTQDTTDGVPIFKTPVVLSAVTPAGRRSEKVWITDRDSVFTFDCAQKPLMVRFDDGDFLLKEWSFERPVDELIYQLSQDDVLGRMWAAGQLGRHADDPRVAPALLQSARSDPFWAVRRDVLYILGGFEGSIDMDERTNIPWTRLNEGFKPGKFLTGGLAGFLRERTGDANPKVRAAAFWAIGNLKDPTLIPFLTKKFAEDDSYGAQAAALVAIGKTGDRSAVPFLRKAAGMESPSGIMNRAAEWALGELK
jgi:aminopeptidase N